MPKKTLSVHNGSTANQDHNRRNPKTTDQMSHIDHNLSSQNEVWKDIPVREAYKQIFQAAVDDYNARQSRSDRKINNYYNHVQNDSRRHTVYEAIVQIGDKRDTGLHADTEMACIREYYDNWEQRNPNLYICGAYLHRDEATVHLHLDYIPVAHGYTRGMHTQNGLVRALGEQGIYKQGRRTAQMQWQDRERQVLERIARNHGIEIHHPDNQRQHMSTDLYKQSRTIAQKELEISRITATLADRQQTLSDLQSAVSAEQQTYTELTGRLEHARQALRSYEQLQQAYNTLQRDYNACAERYNRLIQASDTLTGDNKPKHRKIPLTGNYSVPEADYKIMYADHQLADTYRQQIDCIADYQRQLDISNKDYLSLSDQYDQLQSAYTYQLQDIQRYNAYLDDRGLSDDYNDYLRSMQLQHETAKEIVPEQPSDVADRDWDDLDFEH